MSSSFHRSSCASLAIFFAALTATGGCADEADTTAFDIELLANPAVSTQEQLVAPIFALEIVVDSPTGLYDPEKARTGPLSIRNDDEDDELELVQTVSITDARLPGIRVERGALEDVPLELRVRGRSEPETGELVAAGGVSGIRFTPRSVVPIRIDFNLVPDHRPLRVQFAYQVCWTTCVELHFTRYVDPASLEGSVTVNDLPARVTNDCYALAPLTQATDVIGLRADESLGGVASMEIAVTTGVRTDNGEPFDQVIQDPDAQNYESESIDFGPSVCGMGTPPQGFCDQDQDCNSDARCALFNCITAPTCAATGCLEDSVCDVASGTCEANCHMFGTYPICGRGLVCSDETGLCGTE